MVAFAKTQIMKTCVGLVTKESQYSRRSIKGLKQSLIKKKIILTAFYSFIADVFSRTTVFNQIVSTEFIQETTVDVLIEMTRSIKAFKEQGQRGEQDD